MPTAIILAPVRVDVRRLVHGLGYRYRLHVRSLPGYRGRRIWCLLGGGKLGQPMPVTRVAFWKAKLEGNRSRDARTRARLRRMGWRVLTVWQCQTRTRDPVKVARLGRRIVAFLEGGG